MRGLYFSALISVMCGRGAWYSQGGGGGGVERENEPGERIKTRPLLGWSLNSLGLVPQLGWDTQHTNTRCHTQHTLPHPRKPERGSASCQARKPPHRPS